MSRLIVLRGIDQRFFQTAGLPRLIQLYLFDPTEASRQLVARYAQLLRIFMRLTDMIRKFSEALIDRKSVV